MAMPAPPDDETEGRGASGKLPPGFKAKPEAGLHESGWPLVIVGERDGAHDGPGPRRHLHDGQRPGRPWARPAHFVQLSTYYIDQHEVTNRQFRTFLDDTHYHGQPPGKWLTDAKLRALPDDAPAVFVSYQDAEEYAIWASSGCPPRPSGRWRLARSMAADIRGAINRSAGHGRGSSSQIDPVMSFPEDVSPLGVFDMAGNAVEWVRDWYDPAYFATPARTRPRSIPPARPTKQNTASSAWSRAARRSWLVSDRQGMDADQRLPYVGFRCSLAVEGGEASAIVAPSPGEPGRPARRQPRPAAHAVRTATVPF